ncbi:26S proteasome non-ATPase regulatory subunit 12 [Gracilariopsis chorda]|uniref:26S proteasome non-ATPase regulatory subunit 12 n=1 Tax=Gracilariopsis chorda TaxID=448386 RepID=A0A2V3J4B1_9FLOR|nr:26S proteasome non-ATPase regulatory subunit 12 [Gracilariopsis chorda]|eukprot:PXF49258.1 26S proteasome non-ATPase regulatory subunit 12 [Gracilariopsis chorda]
MSPDKMDIDDGMSTGKYTFGFGPFENDPDLEPKVAEAVALVESSGVQSAIEKLLALERLNRNAGAAPETAAICVNLIRVLHQQKDWKAIGEYAVLISKRRAQLKAAVLKTVQEIMSYLDETPDEETKLSLLETLRDVTAGKIFVELERARLTRILAKIKEEKGDIDTAAAIMQEMQVETFGGMERLEKFEFILEQVRLCLDKNDFIRGAIIAKKIMPRQLNKEELVEVKLRYYALMIRIHTHNSDYLHICRAYLERYDTTRTSEGKDWMRELKLASLLVILSPKDSMQTDLLHRIQGFKTMEELPTYAELLKLFSTDELIRWPILMEQYKEELSAVASLAKEDINDGDLKWAAALQERVTEHNLRVMAKYYSRIRLQRLAELLDLTEENTERKLAAMVSDKKALWAKIDRPAKIVSFARPKDADGLLNGWAENVSSLLDIVEKTCHLVHRETMVHSIGKGKVTGN